VFSFAHRCLGWLSRLLVSLHHFGMAGTLRLFFGPRWSRADTRVSVPIRPMARRFEFRSRSDRGVILSLCREAWRIADTYQRRATVIVDAGANIGDSTLRLRRFHPSARIFAIEADADNFAILQSNFADDERTHCLHRALWSEPGVLQVEKTWANVASRVSVKEHGPRPVTACTVPGLMAEFGLAEIDILKLDIEGAEAVVFQTQDRSWLAKVRCIVFEVCDADDAGTTMSIFRSLEASGIAFNCHVAGECLMLIRSDTPWHPTQDLWLEARASVLPHLEQHMRAQGLERLD